MSPKTRRRRRRWPWIAGILAVLAIISGLALVATGGKPLEDGTELADGRVVVVADGFIAAYLVLLDDGVALVDATLDTEAAAIRGALVARGLDADDVRAIFLTHGHGDHIAGAVAFPDADIYVHAADVDLVEGRRVAGNLPGRFRDPAATGIRITRGLQDGERVDVGGVTFEVFALPGHSRGSAAYLAHGVLFLGDAAGAAANGTITAAPPVFSWDRELAGQSLHELARRLEPRSADIVTLAFGHQGPLDGLGPLRDWHRDAR